MRIQNLVERMGSVRRTFDSSLQTVNIQSLSQYLDTNNPIFKDYLDYLSIYGGETTFIENYEIQPLHERPEYYNPDKEWHIEIGFGGVGFGCIFGEGKEFDDEYTIGYNFECLKEWIPEEFIPISSDVFGGRILLCVAGDNIGKIYFWDSEYDIDEEEFFEDYGIKMPEEVKFRNMFCIGENLYDCFQRMEKAEDDEE